jgi:hypothetical protein
VLIASAIRRVALLPAENLVWRDTFEPDSAARFFALIGASPAVIADPLRTMSAPAARGGADR